MSALQPLIVLGTRPEAIKLAPVVRACRATQGQIAPIVCHTGQHRELVAPLLEYFDLRPGVLLDVMRPDQTLSGLTARLLEALDGVVQRHSPDCLIAQGDTTTCLAAALVAFYRRLPLVHVEAGLRTGNLDAPWPEEFNRRVVSLATTLHCAPTPRAAAALRQEGIADAAIAVTGNTVIDALLWTVSRRRAAANPEADRLLARFGDRRLVLITGHRRESFGEGLRQILSAIVELARKYADVWFVYPVHPNPRVMEPVQALLSGLPNVVLLPPLDYPDFVGLLDRAAIVLTDSGGIQEEAPSLGKPVLVTRETTERPEAVESGWAELVGTDRSRIVAAVSRRLEQPALENGRPAQQNPFGDGHAAERIVELLADRRWAAVESGSAMPTQGRASEGRARRTSAPRSVCTSEPRP
jgi:UDP-N-acetylglucosamine 2-epimerase (non-hydrolysing)